MNNNVTKTGTVNVRNSRLLKCLGSAARTPHIVLDLS